MSDQLLQFTEKGIFCREAGVYIDPWRPVEKAFITHGHSDHARWGHGNYICTPETAPIIKHRLGEGLDITPLPLGGPLSVNGVTFSLHPAGHIPGSAQVRVEYRGEIWVVSGDYKVVDDGLARPFEPVSCHTFITESTFGLPVYKWDSQEAIFKDIHTWWRQNQEQGLVSLITAYSLGKAQRLIKNLDQELGRIYTHGAIENMNEVLRENGWDLPPTIRVTKDIDKKEYKGQLVLAPPSALASSWVKKLQPFSVAAASGWMAIRGMRRRRSVDRGFVLSDHADWSGLNDAIAATGAERIFVTHGYTDIFSRWLQEQGYEAGVVQTEFESEGDSE